MSILGQLIVELKANTASFVEGLSGAGKTAKTVGREIGESLSGLGGAVTGALAPLGEIGPLIGESLGRVGELIGRTSADFAKFGVSTRFLAGAGAAAGAALLATEAGAIGLAVHTALATAELGELSQKTGVSTQTLGGLSVAAKETGVPMEGLAKALEFMNSSAVKAAVAPKGVSNAWTRLGIDVKDTTGHLKDSTTLFLEVTGKLATIPQPEEGYFAKLIFGRGGAEIIPLINLGRDRLQELVTLAKQVGLGDPQTVAASQKFKESLVDVQVEFQGIALQLTKDLLPALTAITKEIGDAFKSGRAQGFIDDLAYIIKLTLAAGVAILELYNLGRNAVKINPFSADPTQTKSLEEGEKLGGRIKDAIKDGEGLAGVWRTVTQEFSKSKNDVTGISSTIKEINEIMTGKLPPFVPPPPKTDRDIDLSRTKEDTTLERIKQRIAALQQEADNWKTLANAGTQAEQLIAEAIKKGDEELGKARAEAARSKTGTALPYVEQNAELIRAAGANAVLGGAIKATISELDKQRLKFEEQGKAASDLAAAFGRGTAAIADAELDKKLSAEQAKVRVLADVYADLTAQTAKYAAEKAKLGGGIGPLPVREVPQSELDIAKTGLDAATAAYQRAKDALALELSKTLDEELKNQQTSFDDLRPKIDAVSDAYLLGDDAVRKAKIDLQLYRFEQDQALKGIVATAAQKQQERKILEDADRQSYEDTLKQEAARYSLAAQYDNEIVKLNRVREVLQQSGSSTLLIDAQLHDAQDRLIHQWDEAAFKVGTFSEKFKGVMGELIIQGRAAGTAIMQAWVSAIDGIETNVAKLLTGQKTNFKGAFENLAESATKAKIQEGVGKLAEHVPGLGFISDVLKGKPDGSTESLALWVKMVGGPGAPASVPFGASNPFAGFGIGAGAPSSGGGLLSAIGSFFGGGFADGGYLGPGMWGIAGEYGPEPIFGGKSGATVMPTSAFAERTTNIIHNHNYPNAASADLFRRTQRQNVAHQTRNMRMAYGV
jgi:hypothetical protein